MIDQNESRVTEAEWQAAREHSRQTSYVLGVVGLLSVAALAVLAAYLAALTVSGASRYPFTAAWLAVFMAPVVVVMVRRTLVEQGRSDQVVAELTRRLGDAVDVAAAEAAQRDVQARHRDFESRLANALEMADGEPEVIEVIERSFAATVPTLPVELLLADNSHAHLLRMASASPTGTPPGCGVDSPDHCPAARRAQVQRFADSDALDACPKLRGRAEGALSAVCVPVSIMGRSVGVIHAASEPRDILADSEVQDLETLAKLAGARIGLLRVMSETQLQAATDSLTGLLNRRSFEQGLAALRRDSPVVSIGMADLDHFKELNDAHGHETGDRALRLFAHILGSSVRTKDLVSRHGGEEFVVALANCELRDAQRILDALRDKLATAIAQAGLPNFTVSVGLVESDAQEDMASLLERADAALFHAKHAGRDQVLAVDASGNVQPAEDTSDGYPQTAAPPNATLTP